MSHPYPKNFSLNDVPGDTHPRQQCNDCGFIHYQNPTIIVACLARWQDRILMAKRAIEPCKGLWTLPGGFMERHETSEQGAARETYEETGATVKNCQLHCVYNIPHISQVYLIYLADLVNDTYELSTSESLEVALVTREEIPWDEIAFSSMRYALTTYFDDVDAGSRRVHHGVYTPPAECPPCRRSP